ncbi:hypothetical protein [Flectobacillus roseus]|uniref:hypothetical protein n=1 Tax=Flectobacillus roseus TaxID=502259 RepID=UPI0024B6D1E6|nr:hypothetical protein [Flectobacillus roseus]MDI9872253.1 hypothetical protein [Flectobacillus roseus]
MENLKEIFEEGLSKKKVSVRKMLSDLGISEPTYYRAIKLNTMSMRNYRKICDYLEIEQLSNTKSIESVVETSNNLSDYWKSKYEESQKTIKLLLNTIESMSLGKLDTVHYSLSDVA